MGKTKAGCKIGSSIYQVQIIACAKKKKNKNVQEIAQVCLFMPVCPDNQAKEVKAVKNKW